MWTADTNLSKRHKPNPVLDLHSLSNSALQSDFSLGNKIQNIQHEETRVVEEEDRNAGNIHATNSDNAPISEYLWDEAIVLDSNTIKIWALAGI